MKLWPASRGGRVRLGLGIAALLGIVGYSTWPAFQHLRVLRAYVGEHAAADPRWLNCSLAHERLPNPLAWSDDAISWRFAREFTYELEARLDRVEEDRFDAYVDAGLEFPLRPKTDWRLIVLQTGDPEHEEAEALLMRLLARELGRLREAPVFRTYEFELVALPQRGFRAERGDWVFRVDGSPEKRPLQGGDGLHTCVRDAQGLPSGSGPFAGEHHHLATEAAFFAKRHRGTEGREWLTYWEDHVRQLLETWIGGPDDLWFWGERFDGSIWFEDPLRPIGEPEFLRRLSIFPYGGWWLDPSWLLEAPELRGPTVRKAVVSLADIAPVSDEALASAVVNVLPHLRGDGRCVGLETTMHGVTPLEAWVRELLLLRETLTAAVREAGGSRDVLVELLEPARRPSAAEDPDGTHSRLVQFYDSAIPAPPWVESSRGFSWRPIHASWSLGAEPAAFVSLPFEFPEAARAAVETIVRATYEELRDGRGPRGI